MHRLVEKTEDTIEIDIFKKIILYLAHIILIFGVIASSLFAINKFSYKLTLGLELVVVLIFTIIIYRKKKYIMKKIKISKNKDFLIPIFICLCTLPFILQKAEMFGMGQDQGVYQTEAIAFATGKTSIYHDFEEHNILDEQQKIEYRKKMKRSLGGFYFNDETEKRYTTLFKGDSKSEVSAGYHGIHVFSALLGGSLKIFKMEGMLYIQTILYLLSICIFFYANKNLKLPNYVSICTTLLFAFSPIVIWISKTAYSEMPLILIVVLYLYYITLGNPNRLEVLSLGTVSFYFAVYHVIFLILYPVFILIHILKNLETGNKYYIFSNITAAVGLYYSATYMSITSTRYYYDNLERLYIKPYVTAYNIKYYILLLAVITVIISILTMKFKNKLDVNRLRSLLIIGCKVIIILSLIYIINYTLKMYAGKLELYIPRYRRFQKSYFGDLTKSATHLSLWALMIFTGFIPLPVLTIIFLKKNWKAEKGVDIKLPLLLLFTYFVFIFGNIFKKEVYYYFYYARYLCYIIPLIVITIPIFLKNKKIIITMTVISLIFMLRLDLRISRKVDDTRIEWSVISEITSNIDKNKRNALIIAEEETMAFLGLPVKYMSNINIYLQLVDIQSEEELLNKNYENVYLIFRKDSKGREDTQNYDLIGEYTNRYSINRFNPSTMKLNNIKVTRTYVLYKYRK